MLSPSAPPSSASLQLRAHGGNLGFGRSPVQPVHVVVAQRGVANQRAHIHCRPRRGNGGNICGKMRDSETRLPRRAGSSDRAVRRAVVPEPRRCRSCPRSPSSRPAKASAASPVADHRQVVMGMHVDEARRQRQSFASIVCGRACEIQVREIAPMRPSHSATSSTSGARRCRPPRSHFELGVATRHTGP